MERTPVNHWEYDAQQNRDLIIGLGRSMGGLATTIGECVSDYNEEKRLEREVARLKREKAERERRQREEKEELIQQIRQIKRNGLKMLCEEALRFGKGFDKSSINMKYVKDNDLIITTFIEYCLHDNPKHPNRNILQYRLSEVVKLTEAKDDETVQEIIDSFLFCCTPYEIASISQEQLKYFTRTQLSYLKDVHVPHDCPMYYVKKQLFGKSKHHHHHHHRDEESDEDTCCRIY